MSVSDMWRTTLVPALLDAAEISDAALLTRLHDAGDAAALELLVYRHGPMVWAACRRILGNHHAAEDAFQATFLALARRSRRIRDSVPAWLHRVAVRAGVDLVRRQRPAELPKPGWEPVDCQPGPVERATLAELAAAIDIAANRLPERLRQAFVLHELHGYSLKETAVQLSCPVGTVESRLARARRRLRGLLAPHCPAIGGALAVLAVPRALRAATVRTALARDAVRPALAALASRAASASGWGRMLPALTATLAAALVVVAVALGHFEAPAPTPKTPESGTAPKSVPTKAQVDSAERELPRGALARLGSTRFRHAGTATCPVAFSPDGRHLATGDNLGVSLFDTQTGKRLQYFPSRPGHSVRVIRFVAKGKQLAIGAGDWNRAGAVTLLEVDNGKELGFREFAGKTQLLIIDITDDGKRILVEDRFDKVFLWDIAAAQEVWAFNHPEASFTMPLTADGKALVLAGSQKAELYDAETGKVLAQFPAAGPQFRRFYNAAGMSPDGKLAVTSEGGQEVAVLDARGDKAVQIFKADHLVNRLLFSPDGQYLVGLSPMRTFVWDTKAAPHSGPVARLPRAAHAGFSKAGTVLALDDAGFLTLWRVPQWQLMPQSAEPASEVYLARFAADGKNVIAFTRTGWVRWPVSGGPGMRITDDPAFFFHNGVAQVSADGRVGADCPGELTSEGKVKHGLRFTDFATGKTRRIEIKEAALNTIEVSPDGAFVTAFVGSELIVCDAAAGQVILRQKQSDAGHYLLGAQLAKDGKSVARSVTGVWHDNNERDPLAPAYKAFYLTDHGTQRELKLEPTPWSVYTAGVRFSDDGTMVIVQGRFDRDWKKSSVAVWDARSGRLVMSWAREGGGLESVRLAPDGRSMTIGDGAGKLAVVEIASGKERASFRHQGAILSAAFHADGTKVVASSPEAPVYVWDLLGGAPKWHATKADALWADLASADATTAFAALRTLRTNPAEGIALLKPRVQLPTKPADAQIADWLKQLDSPKFAEREQAHKDLTAVAEMIESHLAAARKGASLETVRRLDLILKSTTDPTPQRLRHVRACEILEGIGTASALQLLQAWAAGPAGSRLTTEAKASLARLDRR
jgi:RNA polymerase sigma factor (sigma-70 family)